MDTLLMCSSSGSMRSISKLQISPNVQSNNNSLITNNGGSNGKLYQLSSRGTSQKSRSHTRLSGMTSSSSTASSTTNGNSSNNNNNCNNLNVPKDRSFVRENNNSGSVMRMGMDNPMGKLCWPISISCMSVLLIYV